MKFICLHHSVGIVDDTHTLEHSRTLVFGDDIIKQLMNTLVVKDIFHLVQ